MSIRSIERLRLSVANDLFTGNELASLFGKGHPCRNRVSWMVKNKQIVRFKRGLYGFGEVYRRRPIDLYRIANLLWEPSYVSLESALSYYGLIPEAVPTVTSVTSKRTKHYNTPVAAFKFRTIPSPATKIGITESGGSQRIASREKALLDKLYLDFHGGEDEILQYIIESLRVDESDLAQLKTKLLRRYAKTYRSKIFYRRVEYLCNEILELKRNGAKLTAV